MNPYFYLFIIIGMIVLMRGMTKGFRRGFAEEFDVWISMVAAILCLMLVSGIVDSYRKESLTDVMGGIVMLVVFGVAYKLFHMLFGSIRLIAKLPLIRIVDKVLGLLMGLVTGFTTLYVAEYILRNYVLK